MNETIPAINPRRAALLVMDYQAAILGHLQASDELLSRASEAIDAARKRGVQVGYVRVAFADLDYSTVPETNKSFYPLAAKPGFLHKDAPESAIHDRVAPQSGDIIVRKIRVGAFSTTNLHAQLGERDIDTLILAGVSTSGVVLSTVRDAADRDYRIFVLSDACADPDAEVHDLLMRKVFARQTYVITVADLPRLLDAA